MESLLSLAFSSLKTEEIKYIFKNYEIRLPWESIKDEFFTRYRNRGISGEERYIEIKTEKKLKESSHLILEDRAYLRESILRGKVTKGSLPFTIGFCDEFLPIGFCICNIHNLCQYLGREFSELRKDKVWENYKKNIFYDTFLFEYSDEEVYLSEMPFSPESPQRIIEIQAIRGNKEAHEELYKRHKENDIRSLIALIAAGNKKVKGLPRIYISFAASFSCNYELSCEHYTYCLNMFFNAYLGYLSHRNLDKFLEVLTMILDTQCKDGSENVLKMFPRTIASRCRGMPVDAIALIYEKTACIDSLISFLSSNLGYLTTVKYIMHTLYRSLGNQRLFLQIKKIITKKGKYFPKSKEIIESYINKYKENGPF